MKIFRYKMSRYILFVVCLIAIAVPSVLKIVQADIRDDLVQQITLVKTNGDVTNSSSNVANNSLYKQQDNKYYLKIDWDESVLSKKIKPNDEYVVNVSGLLLENSKTVHPLNVNINSNPPVLLANIGTITVVDNKVKIVFNDNVDSPLVNSYEDLKGSIYVRTSVDYNDFIGNTDIDFKAYVNDVLYQELHLVHEDLTPEKEFLVDLNDGKGYVEAIKNTLPGDTFDAKLSITPKKDYIINFMEIDFHFNDYSLEFFTSKSPNNIEHPILGGDSTFDYTLTRTTQKERRSETTDEEKRASDSDWEFRTGTTKEFGEKIDLLFKVYINGKYTGNAFQNYTYKIRTDIRALYKIEKYDEVISLCDTTSLTSPPTTSPVTTVPSTTVPVTTKPVTTVPVTTKPVTTKPVTTVPSTTSPVTTKPVTTVPSTISPVTTKPVTTVPSTTVPVTTKPVTTVPSTTVPVTTKPVTTVPLTTVPVTTKPVTTVPSTTVPVTTKPVTTVPSTTVPVTTKPVTTVPSTTVPVTTKPVTTVPSTTVPSTTLPVTTKPVTTVPSTTSPVTTVPSTTVPVVTTPSNTPKTTRPSGGSSGGSSGGTPIKTITPGPSTTAPTPTPTTVTPAPTTVTSTPTKVPITPKPTSTPTTIIIPSESAPAGKPSQNPVTVKPSTTAPQKTDQGKKPNPITKGDLTLVKTSFVSIGLLSLFFVLKSKKIF